MKKTNTNILLYGVLGGVVFGIVAIPIINYLLDIGLRPLYAYSVGIVLGHLTAWTILILTVEIEPKREIKKLFN
jgi:hypothetical protein